MSLSHAHSSELGGFVLNLASGCTGGYGDGHERTPAQALADMRHAFSDRRGLRAIVVDYEETLTIRFERGSPGRFALGGNTYGTLDELLDALGARLAARMVEYVRE